MKNVFVKAIVDFIITIVAMLLLIIMVILGILVYQEVTNGNAIEKVENIVSTYESLFSDVEDTSKKTTPEIIESTNDDILNQIPSTPTAGELGNVPTVQANYFYSQLEDEAKIIYQALEQNKERMKTGTAQIDLGTSFSELLSTEGGDERLGEYYQSAVETYLYDNPEVFYITANKLYLNIETTTTFAKKSYRVFINSGAQPNYFADEYTSEEQVKQAIQEVENVKNQILVKKTGNAYDDIKMIHDYLVDSIQYDTTVSKDNIYNIYGALINHECVCEGYAEAFKYLLDELNIPCILVIGTGINSKGNTENHAWNYVQLNEKWYGMDVTWDDPVIIGNGYITAETKYRYFLKGRREMEQDHYASTRFTEEGRDYTYPTISFNGY